MRQITSPDNVPAKKIKSSRRHFFFAPHVLECLLDEWHFKQEKKHAEQKTRATKKHAEQKQNLLTRNRFESFWVECSGFRL